VWLLTIREVRVYRTTGVKAVKKEASHGVKVSVLSGLLSLGPGETTRVLRSGVMCLLRLVGVHILTLAMFLALDAVWLGRIGTGYRIRTRHLHLTFALDECKVRQSYRLRGRAPGSAI